MPFWFFVCSVVDDEGRVSKPLGPPVLSNCGFFAVSLQIKFSEIKEKIFKIGAPSLPDSCMPIGMKSEDNKTKLVAVNLNPRDLLNHLIAISLAQVKC